MWTAAEACGRAGMLAPDGRCKTLDASADGYVRAEDCIVLLMTLVEDHGQQAVTAVVHGSAVNQVRQMACGR